jgi:hypothetical protein
MPLADTKKLFAKTPAKNDNIASSLHLLSSLFWPHPIPKTQKPASWLPVLPHYREVSLHAYQF